MIEIDEIRVFEDRAFQRRIVCWSALVVAGGVAALALWCLLVSWVNREYGFSFSAVELWRLSSPWPWCLSFVMAVLGSLVVHELVHGFCFRRFAPPGARVTYGVNWEKGMAYASAEGVVYARRHYRTIILAPTVVVTLGLVAIGIGIGWPLWTIATATAHLSGCTGDWGYLRELRRNPDILWCEDTAWGVRFYGEGAAAGSEEDAGGEDAAGPVAAAVGCEEAAGSVAAAGAADPAGPGGFERPRASFVVVDGGVAAVPEGPAATVSADPAAPEPAPEGPAPEGPVPEGLASKDPASEDPAAAPPADPATGE